MSIKLKITLIILIILAFLTGRYAKELTEQSRIVTTITIPNINQLQDTEYTTSLFFPNFKQERLNKEDIHIMVNSSSKELILKSIVKELLIKLENLGILKKGNYTYEVYIRNRTLYLDLDSKVLEVAKNPQEELLLIYSFVNSLLSPGGADNLVLLINGNSKDKVNFININKSYNLNNNI